MTDLRVWLDRHGLGKYHETFVENEIEYEDLGELSDQDLRELGLPMGPRRRFLKAVGESQYSDDQRRSTSERTGDVVASPRPITRTQAERRQLTVMFADLVGSSELAQRLDPEDLRTVNRRYQDAAKAAIEKMGGYVARYMGDGVLAYFGFPVVHEDDPERAVRAGLALIASLNAQGAAQPLGVRVGIATGAVVVGDLIGEGASRENAVVGETPNLAARLQGIAPPNTVVVAQVTRRLIGGVFRFEALPIQSVKGFAQPVSAFRVTEEVLGQSRFDSRIGARLSPFLGRDEEIDFLHRRLQRAERGQGAAVVLVGDPGIGKSRIAEEIRLEAIGRGAGVLRFQCASYHRNSAFYPLLARLESILGEGSEHGGITYQTVRDYFSTEGRELSSEQVSLLATALGLHDVDAPDELLALDADARRRRTMKALASFMEQFGGGRPLLCVFEDLHWADPSTVEVLSNVVEELGDRPILLIATTRPGFNVVWGDLPHCRVVSLSRLDDSQASALASVTAELSAEALNQVLDRAGGNPLFIEELAQAWVASRSSSDSEQAVPVTLHDSLMARLDATGTGRAVAQCAAVLGREFGETMLGAIWDGDPDSLASGKAALVDAGLVYPRSGVQTEREFLFKHTLVRDAAYNSMLIARRRMLHQLAADCLIERSGRVTRAAPEVIARHLSEAGNLRSALVYWMRAGESASKTSSYRECAAHLQTALSLIRSADDSVAYATDELELLVVLGPALMAQEGYSAPSVGEVYARARELSESMPDKPHLTPVLNGLRLHYICRYGSERGFEPARALLAHAESIDDDASRIEGCKAVGSSLVWTAAFEEARERLRHAIALYEQGENMDVMRVDTDSGLTCYSLVSLVEWATGFSDRGRSDSDRAFSIARRARRSFGLGECLSFRALLLYLLHEYADAEASARQALQVAGEHNYVLWRAMSSLVLGAVRVATGDPRSGLSYLHESGRILKEMDYVLWQPFYLTELANAHGATGNRDAAFEGFNQALAMIEQTSEHFWAPEVHRCRARWLLEVDEEQAQAAFERSLAVAEQYGHSAGQLRAATDLAELWLTVGRARDAHDLLFPIHAGFHEGKSTLALVDAERVLDRAAQTV